MISVFGSTGFVGGSFKSQFPNEVTPVDRESRTPCSEDVLYLISTTHNYHVFDDPTLDVHTNLVVLMETLQEIRGRKQAVVFNFVSSWFVYGECELPAREDMTKHPRGLYSITKSCAEDLVVSFCATHRIPYRILRLANVYGAGDGGAGPRKNALQYLIGQIKKGDPLHLYYGGAFVRDYIHVRDACRAIRHVMRHGDLNTVYNIGSGVAQNFRDLMLSCYRILGKEPSILDVPPSEFHTLVQTKDMVLDVSRLRGLGFESQVEMYDGLVEICSS